MTMNSEPMYWHKNKEWYYIDREKDCFVLTDAAPERARQSFELYKKINNLTEKYENKKDEN